jgi:hypothetical protein
MANNYSIVITTGWRAGTTLGQRGAVAEGRER